MADSAHTISAFYQTDCHIMCDSKKSGLIVVIIETVKVRVKRHWARLLVKMVQAKKRYLRYLLHWS